MRAKMEDKILWVKVNMFISQKDMKELAENIRKQRETGTVVLPSYCEPVIVTDPDLKVEVSQ